MNNHFLRKSLLSLLLAVLALPASADRIELTDGSLVNGRIISGEGGKLKVETTFAGTIEISQASVKHFTTDEPVNVSLASGSTALGKVTAADAGIKVAAPAGELTAGPADVAALWREGAESPAARLARQAAEKAARKWAFEASLAITGRTGASEKFNSALGFKATLASARDRLILSVAAEQAEDRGVQTSDRQFGGIDYSSFYSPDNGWYVRTSLERDKIKDIDLRSLTSLGYSRKLIRKGPQDLEVRFGGSYLYEAYPDETDFDSPGLDLTVMHTYKFSFARLSTTVTYTPTFEDFANYRMLHESSLEVPLTAARWKLKLGLKNDYQSKPPGVVEKFDTTYFTSLILNWD